MHELLPTPRANDSTGPGRHGSGGLDLPTAVSANWGKYKPAVRRWEALTRPAPTPTEAGTKNNVRMSAALPEWMMGLPEGHVTAVPGMARTAQIKAIGNGVVPAQAALALRLLMEDS